MAGTPRRARDPPVDSLDKEFCNQKNGWILGADAGWFFGSSKFCVNDPGVFGSNTCSLRMCEHSTAQ
jgi:hypothetical protein